MWLIQLEQVDVAAKQVEVVEAQLQERAEVQLEQVAVVTKQVAVAAKQQEPEHSLRDLELSQRAEVELVEAQQQERAGVQLVHQEVQRLDYGRISYLLRVLLCYTCIKTRWHLLY